jgi:hypothetical protein
LNFSTDPSELVLILLLGSYDPDTKRLLESLKMKIGERYGGEDVYAFLLDELEIYLLDDNFALVERWSEERISIYLFQHDGRPIENYELELTAGESIDHVIRSLLSSKKEELKGLEIGSYVKRLPILDKLKILVRNSSSIIVVRDKEETRGGEIAELFYCIQEGASDKIVLFKREGFELSSMLMEFLDAAKVTMRTYRNNNDLIGGVLRFLSYNPDRRNASI